MTKLLKLFVTFAAGSLFFMSTCWAETEKYPEGVMPKDVYQVLVELNHYADALLKKDGIEFKSPKMPQINQDISEQVVFQLHLSIIQLLHDYQLNQGHRPIPIVVASPIPYYPVDVKYLSDMLLGQMKKIASSEKVKTIASKEDQYPKYIKHHNLYEVTLKFYLKLLVLSGTKEIDADQLFDELYRVNREVRNIVMHELPLVKAKSQKRVLAASLHGMNPYGGKGMAKMPEKISVKNIFEKTMKLRKDINPLLKSNGVKIIETNKYDKDFKPTTLDVFVQAQILNAELGLWKDIKDVVTSSPVTVQSRDKSYRAVYQSLLDTQFIIDKLALAQSH